MVEAVTETDPPGKAPPAGTPTDADDWAGPAGREVDTLSGTPADPVPGCRAAVAAEVTGTPRVGPAAGADT